MSSSLTRRLTLGTTVVAGALWSLGPLVQQTPWLSPRSLTSLGLHLALGAVGGFLATRHALNPLRRLNDRVNLRHPEDDSPLTDAFDTTECRPLVAGMNRTLARTRTLLGDQRRFMADAAHALKTPLAVVSAQAHVLMKAATAEDRAVAGRELTEGVERAADMVRQLIHVARADRAEAPPSEARVDLCALVETRVGDVVPLALSRDQDLGLEIDGRPFVQADRVVLASMVDNLVGNALRYTPKGRAITVRLEALPGLARISVEDEGPGIPLDQRELAVKRFVRLEPTLATGSGLGLAIVHEGAQRLGGTLRLEDRPDGKQGLRAVLELPATGA